jgi:hypothetical protein
MINATDLEEILKVQRFQGGAYAKLIEKARQYAMMKTTGSYIENGNRITVSHGDRERYAEMFADNMRWAAVDAFVEDALVGAAMQSARTE